MHPDLMKLWRINARRRRARLVREAAWWATLGAVAFWTGWLLGAGVG